MPPAPASILPPAGAPFDLDESLRLAQQASERLSSSASPEEAIQAVLDWDGAMAAQQTWSASQSIRFRQDTSDGMAREAKARLDEAAAALAETRRVFLAALDALEAPLTEALAGRFGGAVLERWSCELRSFDPIIGDELAEEQRLQSEAMALTGGARVEFQGELKTLPAVAAFLTSPDRAIRRAAAEARWGWCAEHREVLDRQFDDLVRVRHDISSKLGRGSFTELAYDRMRRTDYGPDDVALFRSAIEEHVVPLVEEIRSRQAEALGLDGLSIFDEGVHGPGESPTPGGDAPWMEDRATEMFRDVDRTAGTRLGELFERMRADGLLDLAAREGKGAGGFCSFLPSLGVPFIFANFNGTAGDARVFTHEMGHAYQGFSSHGALELGDQRRCTSETAEIHSMSLEFLSWPWMELFFGDAAPRFRAEHLAQQMAFLPYGCAIDHFQHRVYDQPEASALDRHAMWAEVERRYLPWRDWGTVPHGKDGAAWQAQLHVYQYPFYYIDYVLAELVALQLMELSLRDPDEAWSAYQRLCETGGSKSFRSLVKDAGLGDPFDPEVVRAVAERSSAVLKELWSEGAGHPTG
jgi:M3 family oligoendopeptidase